MVIAFFIYIDYVQRSLPVYLDHITVLNSGLLAHVIVDTGLVVTYGMPNLIQIAIPVSHRKMCGLFGETADPECSPVTNGSAWASAWSLSPPGKKLRNVTLLECNSTTAAAFSSDKFCGMLLASVGPLGGCHSIVDPKLSFQNRVCKLCISNGNNVLLCVV